MAKELYELVWEIGCVGFEFIRKEWRVFQSIEEANCYGLRTQDDLNGGLSPDERAGDGYYFEFDTARLIDSIDGCRINLTESSGPDRGPDGNCDASQSRN